MNIKLSAKGEMKISSPLLYTDTIDVPAVQIRVKPSFECTLAEKRNKLTLKHLLWVAFSHSLNIVYTQKSRFAIHSCYCNRLIDSRTLVKIHFLIFELLSKA